MYENIISILCAVVFVIPGFVIITILNRIIPKQKKDYKSNVIEYFIYSVINAFIWGIPFYNVFILNTKWIDNLFLAWLLVGIIIFISPIVIAFVIVAFYQYEIVERICKKMNLRLIENEPSAWDFKFSKLELEWIIVTLTNNEIVAGYMGSKSCASSSNNNGDIYINEVYKINKKGEWSKVDRTDGIWIKEDKISHIEFFK